MAVSKVPKATVKGSGASRWVRRRNFPSGKFSSATILAAAFLAANIPAAVAARPNLLLIVTDDLGRWAVGAYGQPHKVTPNIDRVARDGVRFDNMFVPVGICTPSRATMLTGLWPTQSGSNDVIQEMSGVSEGLPASAPSWMRAVRAAGYRTAMIGKWHLGDLPGHGPDKFGFDHFYGYNTGDREPMNPRLFVDGREQVVPGYLDDLIASEAIRYIGARKDGAPFAMMVSFGAPHMPFGPVPEVDSRAVAQFDIKVPPSREKDEDWMSDYGKPWPAARLLAEDYRARKTRAYFAAAHSADRNIGRVLRELDRRGLTENTVIVLLSDNGFMIGQHGLFEKSDGYPDRISMFGVRMTYKNLFDDSIRVPFLISGPGIPAGAVVQDLTSTIDMRPTILELLGLRDSNSPTFQGRTLTPLFRPGARTAVWRDAVFAQYDSTFAGNLEYLRMVRTKRWKMVIRGLNGSGSELYDLEADPAELRNLYYARRPGTERQKHIALDDLLHRNVIRDLRARLLAWQQSIDDPLLALESTARARAEREARP